MTSQAGTSETVREDLLEGCLRGISTGSAAGSLLLTMPGSYRPVCMLSTRSAISFGNGVYVLKSRPKIKGARTSRRVSSRTRTLAAPAAESPTRSAGAMRLRPASPPRCFASAEPVLGRPVLRATRCRASSYE